MILTPLNDKDTVLRNSARIGSGLVGRSPQALNVGIFRPAAPECKCSVKAFSHRGVQNIQFKKE